MASAANQGLFYAMFDRKLKFGLGDKGFVQGGLVLGGSRGPRPHISAQGSRKSGIHFREIEKILKFVIFLVFRMSNGCYQLSDL